jgi:hypothetical protein
MKPRRLRKTAVQTDWCGKAKRSKPSSNEHLEQCAFISWLAWKYPDVHAVTAAVPNGGWRQLGVAKKLKAEGVSPGYPDVLIDYPTREYHGLRIEFKATGKTWGSVSKDQRSWIEKLNNHGYKAEAAYGLESAKEILIKYLQGGI